MNKLTDNNEVLLRPFDGRWEAILTFYWFGENGVTQTVRVVDQEPTVGARCEGHAAQLEADERWR